MSHQLIANRKRCIIDFLSFLEMVSKAAANSLDLPAFNVISASWSYGMKLDNLVFKFRNAEPKAFFNGVSSMTLDEFVNFSIAPESFKVYRGWLSKIREIIISARISGTVSADTIVAAMAGAKKCIIETSENSKALETEIDKFTARNSVKSKTNITKIDKNMTLTTIARCLSDVMGIKDGVDYFASILDPDSVQKNKKVPKDVASLNTLIKKERSKKDTIFRGSVGIVEDMESARQHTDSNKYVIALDTMILIDNKGQERDASEVLCKLSALISLCMNRICLKKDKHSREIVLSFIDALSSCFEEPKGPKEQIHQKQTNARVVERLENSVFPKMGLLKAKSTFLRGGIDGPPPAQYPYPPGQPSPYGPYPPPPNRQEVYVHEDPYMKTVAGLSVGAQCCTCCALWDLADGVGNLGNANF